MFAHMKMVNGFMKKRRLIGIYEDEDNDFFLRFQRRNYFIHRNHFDPYNMIHNYDTKDDFLNFNKRFLCPNFSNEINLGSEMEKVQYVNQTKTKKMKISNDNEKYEKQMMSHNSFCFDDYENENINAFENGYRKTKITNDCGTSIEELNQSEILDAFISSHDKFNDGRYFMPQRTVGDGDCLIHAACPNSARINTFGMWEVDSSICSNIRECVAAEMKMHANKMKFDYTGKFNPADWHRDPETKKYCLTDEGWDKWCDEVCFTQAWLDVSATQALCRVLGKPILIVQPRLSHFNGGERKLGNDENEGLMNHFSFIYHDPKFFTSIRYFNVTDLDKVYNIFHEESPILVYFNSRNHFSRCSISSHSG